MYEKLRSGPNVPHNIRRPGSRTRVGGAGRGGTGWGWCEQEETGRVEGTHRQPIAASCQLAGRCLVEPIASSVGLPVDSPGQAGEERSEGALRPPLVLMAGHRHAEL